MKKGKKSNRIRWFIITFVALILPIILSACSNGIAKEWICDEIHSGYPDEITFFEDGKGVADNAAFEWRIENEKLYLNFESKYSAKTYDLVIENGKLFLNDKSYHVRADGEKAPKIITKYSTVQD